MALATPLPFNIDPIMSRDQQIGPAGHGDVIALTYNATKVSADCRTGSMFSMTFGAGNVALLGFYNPQPGQVIDVLLKQDGTGSRVITAYDSVLWAAGTAPTLTTTASATDWLRF